VELHGSYETMLISMLSYLIMESARWGIMLIVEGKQHFSSHKSASLLPLQSKNHTNRNQSFKAHRNGIKKPKNYVSKSLKGVGLSLLLPVFSKV